jgi:DNA modification methylase
MELNKIYCGDALTVLKTFPDQFVQCCVTSPPYYNVRDYKVEGQIGLEETVEEFIEKLVAVFHEVYRVLKDDGIIWVNMGDSYCGSGGPGGDFKNGKGGDTYGRRYNRKGQDLKSKDLIGVPWMLAFALRKDGWYLRQELIWHKKSSMPEKVRDRCTKVHEHIFLLSKKPNYKYNYKDILEKTVEYHGKEWNQKPSKKYIKSENCNPVAPKQTMATKGCTKWHTDENGIIMKNKRSVWHMNAGKSVEGHFAVMPDEMVRTCVIAGSDANDVVLDPFSGSGTVAKIAKKLNRQFVGIDLNPEYVKLSEKKTRCLSGLNLI